MIDNDELLQTVNYYYEIKEGTTLLGKPARYLAMFDCHPESMSASMTKLHNSALENSGRAWIENGNGSCYQIKNGDDFYYFSDRLDIKEFSWIKMQAKDIEKV